MLCLVQNFQEARVKSDKGKKLTFFRRRKTDQQGERLLHPDVARDSVGGAFWRSDKRGLSGSAPSMTCDPLTPLDPSLTPSSCRSRQKKFLRHFKVEPDERVIDYYSCALVADILLQGHLYISKNYFAFYSNVFGYVTKLLIPVSSVVNVTKEKTAFILPNAVGVTTTEDRHVFSSLLSRDTTHRLMVQVWRATALSCTTPDSITVAEVEIEESLGEDSPSQYDSEAALNVNSDVPTIQPVKDFSLQPAQLHSACHSLWSLPRSTLLLVIATALLIALFLSASVLMYRLSVLQQSISNHHSPASRSLHEFQVFLDSNLNNLYKVRQSLESFSTLLEGEKEKLSLSQVENLELTEQIPDS